MADYTGVLMPVPVGGVRAQGAQYVGVVFGLAIPSVSMKNYWLNRAKKTGGAFAYWESPTAQPDASGAYYPGGDWGDVVEVVGIKTWQE